MTKKTPRAKSPTPQTPELLRGQPVSGVYQDYVEPLVVNWANMRPRPSIAKLNHLCTVPRTIWNMVVLNDFYPQVATGAINDEMRSITATSDPAMPALVEFWTERKRSLFGKFRYMFRNAEFYQKANGEIRCRAEAVLPSGVTEAKHATL